MSFNTFGKIFRFTTWGESHGPAIGCIVDGCPPNIALSEKDIQKDMNLRRPGNTKFVSQRKESDKMRIKDQGIMKQLKINLDLVMLILLIFKNIKSEIIVVVDVSQLEKQLLG